MAEAKRKTVTYLGPVDPLEIVTVYRLPADTPEGEDVVLTKGIPGEASESQIRRLLADDEHRFVRGEPDPNAEDSEGAPWTDYGDLNADDIVKRINDPELVANAEAAQAIADYENAQDNPRKTVVEAAEHQAAAYNPQGDEEGE